MEAGRRGKSSLRKQNEKEEKINKVTEWSEREPVSYEEMDLRVLFEPNICWRGSSHGFGSESQIR